MSDLAFYHYFPKAPQIVADNSLRGRIEQYIEDVFPDADRFDIEEAIYWYASDYHSGQASELYSILSTSPFNPSPLAHGPEGLAEEIYNALTSDFN